MTRRYFSQRENGAPAITTQDFAYRFYHILEGFALDDYFNRLDIKFRHSLSSSDKLKRELAVAFGPESDNMLPTERNLLNMRRNSIFDLIEFLSEYVSEPHPTNLPPFIKTIRVNEGLEKWRRTVNECLEQLDPPYNLTTNKEIEIASPSAGLRRLVDDYASPSQDAQEKIDHACRLFLKRNATVLDRRSALKDLADILEMLRDDLNASIGKKKADKLFDIANNYGIRHNNREQLEMNESYARWFFYSALSTIDLVVNLGKSSNE